MDITKKSMDELKALAYDLLMQGQEIQNNLQIINKQIQIKFQEDAKAFAEKEEAKKAEEPAK